MRIRLKVMNFCFIGLIALLLIALIATVCVIANKNDKIEELKLKSIETSGTISEKTEKEKELQEKLEQSEKEKSDIQAKLEASESEKSKLEAENNSLKNQIEQLRSAKREARLQAALDAAAISPANPDSNKICYLTFDDGPSNNTLEILRILKKYHVKATFFVINTSKIDYVKNIHADGHTVGLHTTTHKYDEIYSSVDAYFADLLNIQSIVESRIGVKPNVIRFPGGTSNGVSKQYCTGIMTTLSNEVAARGFSYFDWNVASGDASGGKVASATIVNNVVNQSRNKEQICVLMHDAANKYTTVEALEDMIAELILLGFRFESLNADVQVSSFRHPPNN